MRNIPVMKTYNRSISVLISFGWWQGLNQDCWIKCLCSVINSMMLDNLCNIQFTYERREVRARNMVFLSLVHEIMRANDYSRTEDQWSFSLPNAYRRWLSAAKFFYCSGNIPLNTRSPVYLFSMINIHTLLTIKPSSKMYLAMGHYLLSQI